MDRCDNMVLAWIMHTTIKNISDSIMFSSTSHHAWLELEQRYSQADGTRIFEVQRDLCSISQNNLSIADYFTEIKKLWDEYNAITIIPHCSCGLECTSLKAVHKMIDNQQLIQFLIGLNDDYKTVRGNLLMMRPLPSLSQAYNVILQEEKQRGLSSVPHIVSQSAAFSVQTYSGTKSENSLGIEHVALAGQQRNNHNFSYKARNDQYISTVHPAKNGPDRRPYYCDHCKMQDHTIKRCYKLHGYPPGHKLHTKGRRFAATVHTEPLDNQNESAVSQAAVSTSNRLNPSPSTPVPGLTDDQYTQLIALLHKHTSENSEVSHAGFMAGPHLAESSGPW